MHAAAQPTAPPFGTYLSGVVAGALGDADAASGRLLQVLGSDPGDPGLRSQAFIFSTLAGRPDAVRLAPLITSNPLAPLVSGNARALAGDWAGAQASYGGIERTPLNQLLQPLLLAWAEQGAGHTDLAMTRLVPLTQGNPIAGVYALHAAMIADLAGPQRPGSCAVCTGPVAVSGVGHGPGGAVWRLPRPQRQAGDRGRGWCMRWSRRCPCWRSPSPAWTRPCRHPGWAGPPGRPVQGWRSPT